MLRVFCLMLVTNLLLAETTLHNQNLNSISGGVVGYQSFYYECSADQSEIRIYACDPKKVRGTIKTLDDCSSIGEARQIVNVEKFKAEYIDKIKSKTFESKLVTDHQKTILLEAPTDTKEKIDAHLVRLETGIASIKLYIEELKRNKLPVVDLFSMRNNYAEQIRNSKFYKNTEKETFIK